MEEPFPKMLCNGSYQSCLQAASKNAIKNNIRWLIKKKSNHRIVYKCAQEKCTSTCEVRASLEDGNIIWGAFLNINHHDHDQNKFLSKPLREHLMMAIAKASALEPKSLTKAVSSEVNVSISSSQISRIKRQKLLDNAWESLWRKLPSFVEAINSTNELADLKMDGNEIKSLFLTFPYAHSFCNSNAFLNIIFIDGTFNTDHCKSTLLTAVTITADKIILPLAVALTDGETIENYYYFFSNLSKHLSDSSKNVFLSDQHPAISAALTKVFPNCAHVPCAWHIAQKIRCPKVVFFELLITDNVALFNIRWESFQKDYKASAEKISKFINNMAYVKNNRAKYGFISDSPIEAFHSAIAKYRCKEPLFLLSAIICWASKQRSKQLKILPLDLYCTTTTKLIQ